MSEDLDGGVQERNEHHAGVWRKEGLEAEQAEGVRGDDPELAEVFALSVSHHGLQVPAGKDRGRGASAGSVKLAGVQQTGKAEFGSDRSCKQSGQSSGRRLELG